MVKCITVIFHAGTLNPVSGVSLLTACHMKETPIAKSTIPANIVAEIFPEAMYLSRNMAPGTTKEQIAKD
jgi:hypothetical protein